ncbi:EcoAI/FtnUII family type I restriction enzme subunit R [Sphaerimonospora sp. CA-214678]|uniref:EcoAI/FtnUII family type I restriction enzme subunit R n=1 Tax=Sphaerimonospora sp. CA-214678 TaxID=3240029 RepID=UPI003D8C72A6
MNEADTCRKEVVPRLVAAGWDNEPHSFTEQRTFTDGRIIPLASGVRRGKPKRADFILRYTRDFPIAVVEAKANYKTAGEGLQQAKEYALILGLMFAYSTNGREIIEHDFTTGRESRVERYPAPAELLDRYLRAAQLGSSQRSTILEPYNLAAGKKPRYYQEVAINRAIEAIAKGQRRILLTMATGTGKTATAFQICWKLWNSRWNRHGEHRRPRILYLADRNVLVDDPMNRDFAAFGDAAIKIESGLAPTSREIYFAIYQAIARDEKRPGLYRRYPTDFFDLVIVDECHRGSANEGSSWREILEYFKPAVQLGLTATPLRNDNRDTYAYFGNPVYSYSLRQGIQDGFLAPYRVHRIITTVDAAGWRPTQGDLDRYGREIPDREYRTQDFERIVALRSRTDAIARHLADYMHSTDRSAKTIVFCVDQEHADEMRRLLNNHNADLALATPDYVCRVTADEGAIGRAHLSKFQDVETSSPVILTTSQLLTTGVDAPTVQNIVLARVVGSISEFKQIIGRGTRVRDDYGKYYFTILDYTGSATRMFADPEFDGEPAYVDEIHIDDEGEETRIDLITDDEEVIDPSVDRPVILDDADHTTERRKYYFDGGIVEIAHHLVYELDTQGKQLRVVSYSDYTAKTIRSLYSSSLALREGWADMAKRAEIIERLEERGIDFDKLASAAGMPESDPFDLLCHFAFNAPLRTRRERAQRLIKERTGFFDLYGPSAKAVLHELLDKYAEHGMAQFKLPDVLKLKPISDHGNVREIAALFGGVDSLRQAVSRLQEELYAA